MHANHEGFEEVSVHSRLHHRSARHHRFPDAMAHIRLKDIITSSAGVHFLSLKIRTEIDYDFVRT